MHWLIVIPYYFFGALALTGALVLLARLLRLKVAVNTLVTAAVILSMVTLVLTLASERVSIDDFGAVPMLVLGLLSFVLAGLDAALMKVLPHALDEELIVED